MESRGRLAEHSVPVHLVEKEAHLGGYLGSRVEHTVDGLAPVAMATDMKLEVFESRNIAVHLNCEVEKTVGALGSFESKPHFKDKGNPVCPFHVSFLLKVEKNVLGSQRFRRLSGFKD